MQLFLLEARGVEATVKRIKGMGHRGTTWRPIFYPLIRLLIHNEKQVWARNGGGGRNHWPENTASTLATKAANNWGDQPMRATHHLEKSLTRLGAADQIARGGGVELVFGTSVWYAQFSQGAKNPKRKRKVLWLLPKTRRNIREIILAHIVGGP